MPNGRQMGAKCALKNANPRKSIKTALSNVLLSNLKSEKINTRKKHEIRENQKSEKKQKNTKFIVLSCFF